MILVTDYRKAIFIAIVALLLTLWIGSMIWRKVKLNQGWRPKGVEIKKFRSIEEQQREVRARGVKK